VLLCPALTLGQAASEVKMSVQLDKFAWYFDNGDPSNFATVTQSLAPLPTGTTRPMMRNAILADMVSVNGKPARGAYVSHGLSLRTTNSDLGRNHAHYFALDIWTPEGIHIGDLFGTFLSAGASAPGAPVGAGNWAVHGGSGAYLGIRGQGSNVGASNFHMTLMKEDTDARRTNSSGQLKLDLYLSGVNVSEIQAAYHLADGTPVTSSNPARAGEVLILQVKAGWPVSPPLEPGQTFAKDPLQIIACPVEATVNDLPAEVINAIGWPGTRDRYRVDVRLPATGTPEATLNLLAGYILASVPYKLPVR
jgi:hypothetical protein